MSNHSAQNVILQPPPVQIITEWQKMIRDILNRPEQLYGLDWKTFENLIGELLESFGWAIEPMGYTKDDGIDLIAVRKICPGVPIQMMIQCKRYSMTRKVGVDYVKNVWATKSEHGFHQAMLATTSTFTRGAVSKGNLWNLNLCDHNKVLEWCREYGTHSNSTYFKVH